MLKFRHLCSVVLVMLFAGSIYASDFGEMTGQIKYKAQTRDYLLFIPQNLAPGKPLVIMLHGYSGHADLERFGMKDAAAQYGFVLCCPQGEKNGLGKTGWNVRYPAQAGLKTDDVDFITKLAAHLVKKYDLDKKNVFLAGHSNGGEMCYLTALSAPRAFRAYASLAGLTLEWMLREYDASTHVPFMEIHGTEDRTSRWEGDPLNEGGWGQYVSVPLAVGNMTALNKCTHEITETIPSASGKQIIAHKFVGGTDGNEVWLYEIVGGKHSWTQEDLDTGGEIWKFFSKYITLPD